MMKLHLDKYAFDTVISNISKRSNIRSDILEKDYYVTLILNEQAKRLVIEEGKHFFDSQG